MNAGWKIEPLKALCEFRRGLTYSKSDEVETSDTIVLRANNIDLAANLLNLNDLHYITDEKKVPADKRVLKDSIIVCTASGSKSHLGKVAYIGSDYGFAFGGFMGMVTPKVVLHAEYLFHMMTSPSYKKFIDELSDGVNINNLRFEDLGRFPVPYPPLVEQRRIVSILNKAFEGIATAKANAKKNLQHARALFESHLHSVFADAWQTHSLGTLSALASNITDGDHLPPPKSDSGVPFITIRNIIKRTRQIDFADTFKVAHNYFNALKENKRPRRGDVLYTVTGSFGIPVTVGANTEFCFQRHIGLIRPASETDSAWLYYLLLSPQVIRQAEAGATGAAQRTVSLAVLRNFEVPIVPIQQQKAMTRKLDSLSLETQRLEGTYQQKLVALEGLKKTLLHEAFTGNL